MPVVEHNTNYVEDGDDLLMEQFFDSPNVRALLQTISEEVQELEDVYYNDLLVAHLFRNMTGHVLTKTAELLGITRGVEETDSELSPKVIGAILGRSSDGTLNRIREILQALTDLKDMHGFQHYPGSLLVYGVSENPNYRLQGQEAEYLRAAAPVTTGSTVFGVVRGQDNSRLFIPSEIAFDVKQLVVEDLVSSEFNLVAPDGGVGLNNIVVRDEIFSGFTEQDIRDDPRIANAIMAETTFRDEVFRVNTASGEVAFQVDTTTGREDFQVTIAGIDNTRGILLDTVQTEIPIEREPHV